MTSERWQQINALVLAALERAPDERAAFLDAACAGDPELRAEVESLLGYDEPEGGFIETPAWAAAESLMEEEEEPAAVGRRIGPYRIVREIGRGGMGVVYRAERDDGEVRKQVAIKLIKRGMDTDAILRRFRHERQILADLDHPNIVRLLDAGTTADGLPYYIMDYVEGRPVDEYCDTNELSIEERLTLFRTVCAAVHYAHERHVIHRDLKPSNILVTADGVPKLLDFGIAKVLNPAGESPTGEATGPLHWLTPEYASPEQVRGSMVTPQSDLYSLGVLLYELLTGHRPYCLTDHGPQEIERIICETDPEKPSTAIHRVEERPGSEGAPPVRITPESVSATRARSPEQLRRRLAGDLDTIVLMALRKEPERRYPSVEQLSEDVRRHLEGRPVMARRNSLAYRGAKLIKRNRARVIEVAIVALVLTVLVGIGFYQTVRRPALESPAATKPKYSLAVLPFKVPGDQPENQYQGLSLTDVLINKLSTLQQVIVRPVEEVRKYAKARPDRLALGRELRVDVLLDGTLERSGDRMRIGLDLLQVRDGSMLWTHQLDVPFADFFKAQDFILEQVSQRLHLQLSEAEKKRLAQRYTNNLEAYELYEKCQSYVGQSAYDDVAAAKQAMACFEQVVAKDPNFALAHAGVGTSWIGYRERNLLPYKEAYAQAEVALKRALALDENCAPAHRMLVYAKQVDRDWAAAEHHARRAIALEPNRVTAHRVYAQYLANMGRFEEALAEVRKIQELLDRPNPYEYAVLGNILNFARRYDEAIALLKKSQQENPNGPRTHYTHFHLGTAYLHTGRFDEALAEMEKANQLQKNEVTYRAWQGHIYGVSRRRAKAQQVLAELQALARPQEIPAADLFLVHLGLGNKEEAFACLEKLCAEHHGLINTLKVNPLFDPLRADPRFADLLWRVGLPP